MGKRRWTGVTGAALLLSFAMLFSGCAGHSSREPETGVKIGADGEITAMIVESFDREYYTEEGLQQFIREEMQAYGKGRISVIGIDRRDDGATVSVGMRYGSAEDYAAFNEVTFFYGTAEEAQAAGYSLNTALVNAKGASVQGGADALAGKHVVIFSETMLVTVPTKVLYRSEGSTLVDSKSVRASGDGGLTYVIIK